MVTNIRSGQIKDASVQIVDLEDFAVLIGSGLYVAVQAGRLRNGLTIVDASIASLLLTDNASNYVEVASTGVATANTSGFTAGYIPLAIVVTASGSVSSITDKRAWTLFLTTGPAGATGPQGPTGPQGTEYTWKGAWVSSSYSVNDCVEYQGSGYICILDATTQNPTNATYWSLLVQKGSAGPTGPQGPTGADSTVPGPTGPTGPAGATSHSKSFVLTNPTSSTDGPIWRVPAAITITAIHVLCMDGTNIVGQLWEYDTNGANGSTVDSSDITGTAGTNVNDDGALSNPGIAAGNYLGWKTTSVSGAVTKVIVTYDYTVN